MRKIILDVDTGTGYHHRCPLPHIELKVLTCVHRNLPLPNTTENTLRITEFVCPGVPVYAGCARPMVQDIVKTIEELVVMGGGIRWSNASQAAEANFFLDPDAAAIMLQANTRITILPLDATSTATFSEEEGAEFMAIGNDVAKFFGQRIIDMVKVHKIRGTSQTDDPSKPDAAIHDALCILYLIDPSVITVLKHQTAFVHIGGGVCEGMLVADNRAGMPVEGDIHIAYQMDKQKIKAMLIALLKTA